MIKYVLLIFIKNIYFNININISEIYILILNIYIFLINNKYVRIKNRKK